MKPQSIRSLRAQLKIAEQTIYSLRTQLDVERSAIKTAENIMARQSNEIRTLKDQVQRFRSLGQLLNGIGSTINQI